MKLKSMQSWLSCSANLGHYASTGTFFCNAQNNSQSVSQVKVIWQTAWYLPQQLYNNCKAMWKDTLRISFWFLLWYRIIITMLTYDDRQTDKRNLFRWCAQHLPRLAFWDHCQCCSRSWPYASLPGELGLSWHSQPQKNHHYNIIVIEICQALFINAVIQHDWGKVHSCKLSWRQNTSQRGLGAPFDDENVGDTKQIYKSYIKTKWSSC